MGNLGYSNLTAHTVQPNTSYLSNTHTAPIADPMSGSTMGLMMLMSAFQFQTPYMNPIYANAATTASKQAYTLSGGQKLQDDLTNVAGKDAVNWAHVIGLTDGELGVAGGAAKILRDKKAVLNGPKINTVKTSLTIEQSSGIIGFKYEH